MAIKQEQNGVVPEDNHEEIQASEIQASEPSSPALLAASTSENRGRSRLDLIAPGWDAPDPSANVMATAALSSQQLPSAPELRKLKCAELKQLAIAKNIKRPDKSWNACFPPKGRKQDIIDELLRKPGDVRPKAAGKGWIPAPLEKFEKKCRDWLDARQRSTAAGVDFDDYEQLLRDCEHRCSFDSIQYKQEGAFESMDDDSGHDYFCTRCKQECDWREWHCKGCDKCLYGHSIPCEKCIKM